MPHHALLLLLVLFTLVGCANGCTGSRWPVPARRITRTFPAEGVSKVIVRAAMVDSASIRADPQVTVIEISGLPAGGAKGYHPVDPSWRETPAQEWGLDLVAAQHGNVLVVSSKNEIGFIHHQYTLRDLQIRVPPNVEVVRQARELTGKGEPDLKQP